ncbi:dTDP-4-dehydrorhamnose 3,5-epimerase [Metabacillus halosaccharovorans]|uniref:dTDP-4-dehydrorhamnose 3,5-epimerase n=1 Tax=Metabacillus halosaccharovorans TaxID=930124 RepID=UPI0034CF20EA
MRFIETKFQDVKLFETIVHKDQRGFFTESYNYDIFCRNGIEIDFVQDNHSLSVEPGVLRGLHYQLNPMAQSKLVRVLSGAIYDVVVDLRESSATFGQWQGFILSSDNKRQLFVPQGFAHGFCTLVSNTEVFYKVDNYYSPKHDCGIAWDDPDLNIDWPFSNPIISEKDRDLKSFLKAEKNF